MEIKQNRIIATPRSKYIKYLSEGSKSSGNSNTNVASSVLVYNGLDSTSIVNALSANMGKYLQDNKADKTELHTHSNFNYLDLINQNLSTTSNPLFNSLNLTSYIHSPEFISGFTGKGWKIEQTFNPDFTYKKSYAEFDSLFVRGSLTASEFILNQIRATNGNLAVTDSAKIESVLNDEITISGEHTNMMVFQTGDILKCQKFTGTSTKMYKIQVVSTSGLTFKFTTVEGSATLIKEGDILVRWTSIIDDNRKGLVYLTNSDSYSPYIDTTYDGVTKARFGRLDGIVVDGSALSGYGIYCDNGYFKGNIVVTGGNAATKDYVAANTAKHCGDWKADTSYIKSSIVTFNNCTWMALNDVPSNYAPNTEYLLSSAGRYLYVGDAALGSNVKNWELISERDYSKILGYTDYASMLAQAEAGTTIIKGGYINTNLINTNALIVNGGLATASDLNTALNPYLKSETIIEGGYIKSGLINVQTLLAGTVIAESILANGINVNNKFIVTTDGNVSISGNLTAEIGSTIGGMTVRGNYMTGISSTFFTSSEHILNSNIIDQIKKTQTFILGNTYTGTISDSSYGVILPSTYLLNLNGLYGYSFRLTFICAYNTDRTFVLSPFTGTSIIVDANGSIYKQGSVSGGSNQGYIKMVKGDIVELLYHNDVYYVMNHRY